jgi:hypothetical protein
VTFSMLIRFWFASLLLTAFFTKAQVAQIDRFEIPLTQDGAGFDVTSLYDKGILLHRRLTQGPIDNLEVVKYDTSFKESWRGFIGLNKNYSIAHKRYNNSRLHILLNHRNYYDFQIIVLEDSTGKYSQYDLHNYIPFLPTQFEVNDKGAIIGGYFNRVPIVIFFEYATLRLKVLPGLFSEVGELTQIKTYADNTFDVLLSARYFNREKTVWIKSYTPEGDFINQLVLPVQGNKSLLFGRSLQGPDYTKIIAGVYGNRNSEFSKGIFVASIDAFGNNQVNYYGFAELDNFFGYLKAKREQRIKMRIEKRKLKGKKKQFSFRLLVHEFIPYQNQFVLLGEVFYPRYTNVDRRYGGGYFLAPGMGPNSSMDRIFDGYRYTHATILGFNANGKLAWDNTFEINDVKTFQQEQFVKIKPQQEQLTLLYLFNNQIRSKVIDRNKVVEGKSVEPIKTLFVGDKQEEGVDSINKLEYWYGEYLFAYGTQTLINTTERGDKITRNVFFVNKIKCQK